MDRHLPPHRASRSAALARAVVVALAGSLVVAAAPALGRPPTTTIHTGGSGTVPYVAEPPARLLPNDSLPIPPWWHGMCDGSATTGDYPGSVRLGAVFDGLVACGRPTGDTGDSLVQFFTGAWGEYEWECVELSMRWMYQAWGVEPYGANGNTVVANYPNGEAGYPALQAVKNGTAGAAPQIGDVLSMDDSDPFGHTEVVAGSSVNSAGNGTLEAITENYGNGNDGWIPLTVSNWVVSSPGMDVLGWLHNPAWSLQVPVLWQITSSGDLQVKDSGGLVGTFATVATGIASAQVVGGEGARPAPLVAALTTSGTLLAGYLVPGATLHTVASGVKSFVATSGNGSTGRPMLGWLTTTGAFDLADGAVSATPAQVAKNAVDIALAPGSGPENPVLGYITATGGVYVSQGSAAAGAHPAFTRVGTGAADQLVLAGGGDQASQVVEGYLGRHAGFWERQGTGAFSQIATDVAQISAATVGTAATPLLGDVSTTGTFEVREGTAAWTTQGTGVESGTVSGGDTAAGFPLVAELTTKGAWSARQGTLNAVWHLEGAHATAAGASALTVS